MADALKRGDVIAMASNKTSNPYLCAVIISVTLQEQLKPEAQFLLEKKAKAARDDALKEAKRSGTAKTPAIDERAKTDDGSLFVLNPFVRDDDGNGQYKWHLLVQWLEPVDPTARQIITDAIDTLLDSDDGVVDTRLTLAMFKRSNYEVTPQDCGSVYCVLPVQLTQQVDIALGHSRFVWPDGEPLMRPQPSKARRRLLNRMGLAPDSPSTATAACERESVTTSLAGLGSHSGRY
jgi:hypothetical protein